MKNLLKYLFLLSSLSLLPAPLLAMTEYQLDLFLIPAEQRLSATAQISFATNSQPSEISLQLAENCVIEAVEQTDKELHYSFQQGELKIVLTGTGPLTIRYRGLFTDQVAQTPVHNEDPSYGISASISEAGVYLSAGADWYPRLIGEQINYRVNISAPLGTEAITSGQRLERQTSDGLSRSSWRVDYPLYGLTLSAGPYQVTEDHTGSVPIYAYFYADSAPLAETYLHEARSYLQLYEELFGPYPFHKFAIVENFFPTGYGLPSWTLLGSSVIKLPFIVKTSLGHEIAHCWWGTGVQVDYAQGNWAEGLTTYVADYLYKERSSAEEALAYRQNILRDYATLVDAENVFPLSGFSSRQDKASQSIGYGKSAMLFHMLRQKLGEQVFWAGLRQLADKRRFERVGWSDFSDVYSTIAGESLQLFFQQWLNGIEGPQLALQDVTRVETGAGWQVSGRLTQQPTYQLDVVLQLTTETEILRKRVQLDSASQSFEFATPARPIALQVDPETELFRILADEEIPATINSIRGSNQLLVLLAENHAPASEARTALLGAMRKTQLPVRLFAEVTKQELSTHDLLIFGLPEQFTPARIAGSTAESFTFADKVEDATKSTAFVAQRNPTNSNLSAAWFIGRDPLATVVARKVPHYGKYSYLLFDGAENRLKGVMKTESSPLKIEFK